MRATLNRTAAKWALFVVWPAIAMLLLVGVSIVIAACWIVIPFGRIEPDGENKWSLKFPWSG